MTLQMYLASAVLEGKAYPSLAEQSKLVDLVIGLLSGLMDVTSEHQLRILAEQQGLEQALESVLGAP